jgi:uncharacterized membrane protein
MFTKFFQNLSEKKGQKAFASLPAMLLTMIASVLFLLVYINFIEVPFFKRLFFVYILISGLIYTVSKPLRFYALGNGEVSIIIPLINTKALFSLVFSWIFLNDTPNQWGLLGVILIVFGGMLIKENKRSSSILKKFTTFFKKNNNFKAEFFLILSVILSALINIFDKLAMQQTTPIEPAYTLLIRNAVTIPILAIIIYKYIPKKKKINLKLTNVQENLSVLFLMGFFYTITNILSFSAFSETNIGYVMAIKQLSSPLAVLVGGIFYQEKNIPKKALASILMSIGAYIIGSYA